MAGRLNIFQRTMLQWDEIHPYNAIHVARISAVLDFERLGHVIRTILVRLGLTGFQLEAQRTTYVYQGGPAQCDIKLVATDDPATALLSEIEHHLNTRFLGHGITPFRFFVVPESGGFAIGLVYYHVVADAEAIVYLFKRIVAAYLAGDAGEVELADVYPAPRDSVWRRPGLLLQRLAATPRLLRQTRRSCRPTYHNIHDTRLGFTFFRLPADALTRLTRASKAWGVTVNDLFLALLLRSLAPQAESARKAGRQQVSVGCIVNLRRELGLEGPRTFGLFLGSFIITESVPPGMNLRELAVAVQEQTDRIKRARLFLTSALELRFARRMLAFFSTDQRKKLYQKHYPLWGGVTNMNLNALWPDTDVDYFRAVSTGPATPLVLSVTTVRDAVNVGLSFRRTVFSPADIGRIQGEFLAALASLEIGT